MSEFWFQIFVVLHFYRLIGAKTCPECRTFIRNKSDIKPAFLSFPAADETQLELSKREQDSKEKDQIIAELLLEKSRLKKKINLDALRIERLTSQKEKLERTLQKTANATRSAGCHTRSMMSNEKNKNKVSAPILSIFIPEYTKYMEQLFFLDH